MGHFKNMEESVSLMFSHMPDFIPVVFLSVKLYDAMCHKNKLLCQVPDNVV